MAVTTQRDVKERLHTTHIQDLKQQWPPNWKNQNMTTTQELKAYSRITSVRNCSKVRRKVATDIEREEPSSNDRAIHKKETIVNLYENLSRRRNKYRKEAKKRNEGATQN
ncbi:hypothetical protein GQ457_06G029030 [Hibiscus cannabinus]